MNLLSLINWQKKINSAEISDFKWKCSQQNIAKLKINELDPEDKTLLENEIGGVLRCIEFIYKSSGVNRPLRANEDHPQDNLNKNILS